MACIDEIPRENFFNCKFQVYIQSVKIGSFVFRFSKKFLVINKIL